ncbi:unnamed protein product [Schistocephalus solidus]|uniref:N-terminal methionine N(alpha)-acetyltransferase NatE n=1 Tax=Schistocephalus solidus TaxID=70667 RepID=A0A3P7DJV8_SCHSO|nr:unnamed protein product [Schistocephalus solidus]
MQISSKQSQIKRVRTLLAMLNRTEKQQKCMCECVLYGSCGNQHFHEQMSILEKSTNGEIQKLNSKYVRLELGELTPHNIKQLRIINRTVFPVLYTEKFYTDLLKRPKFCRLAYFNDIVVGAVCYRIESPTGNDNSTSKKCYIMTLGCLAPYRRHGIGSMLLKYVLHKCRKNNQIKSAYLHVHIENEEAIKFYQKFGFEVAGRVESYYHRLSPQDAFILEKQIDHSEPVSSSDSE